MCSETVVEGSRMGGLMGQDIMMSKNNEKAPKNILFTPVCTPSLKVILPLLVLHCTLEQPGILPHGLSDKIQ